MKKYRFRGKIVPSIKWTDEVIKIVNKFFTITIKDNIFEANGYGFTGLSEAERQLHLELDAMMLCISCYLKCPIEYEITDREQIEEGALNIRSDEHTGYSSCDIKTFVLKQIKSNTFIVPNTEAVINQETVSLLKKDGKLKEAITHYRKAMIDEKNALQQLYLAIEVLKATGEIKNILSILNQKKITWIMNNPEIEGSRHRKSKIKEGLPKLRILSNDERKFVFDIVYDMIEQYIRLKA